MRRLSITLLNKVENAVDQRAELVGGSRGITQFDPWLSVLILSTQSAHQSVPKPASVDDLL